MTSVFSRSSRFVYLKNLSRFSLYNFKKLSDGELVEIMQFAKLFTKRWSLAHGKRKQNKQLWTSPVVFALGYFSCTIKVRLERRVLACRKSSVLQQNINS